ncbi:MAG: hypothetical protein WCR46_02875 [Deltaproteobacteria bacterium]
MAQDTDKTDQWQFVIEPYLWMAGIKGSTTSGTDFSVDFNDLLSNLKFSYMGIAGVKKGKWSFLVDTIYMDVKGTKDGSISEFNRTLNTHTEVQVKSWVVTPVIGYNVIDCERGNLDIVAGARYFWTQVDVDVSTSRDRARNPQVSVSGDVWDGIVGLRSEIALYGQLYMPLYLDIGTGESDFTWQAAGGLGYRFGLCDVIAGYRYLSWDFKDSSPLNNMNLSGPYIGLGFMF